MEHNSSNSTQASNADIPDVQFVGVTKRFGDVAAVDNVDLSVERGGFFSFLGPSGCGKTTSLRMIAGFEQPTEGSVFINGQNVVGIPPHKRNVNMVFQQYALFPHMNVAENIGYGLRQRTPKPTKDEISRRVDETLELVRLTGYGNRRVWEMSGGQQQRVALARALINHPTVLLLDEPLAALDRKLRREMQIELQTLQRDVGITFVLVTHDQEEALSMSDNICIMRDGQIVQSGGPRHLYDAPVNRYVADFVGKSNFFDGSIVEANGGSFSIKTANGQVFSGNGSKGAPELIKGADASIAIRPELLTIGAADGKNLNADIEIQGQIKNRIFLGEHTEYLVDCEGLGDVLVLSPKHIENVNSNFETGDRVSIGWMNDYALVLGDT